MEFHYNTNSKDITFSVIRDKYILTNESLKRKIELEDICFDENEILIDSRREDIERKIYVYFPKTRKLLSTYCIYKRIDRTRRWVPGVGPVFHNKFQLIYKIIRNKHESEPTITEQEKLDLSVLFGNSTSNSNYNYVTSGTNSFYTSTTTSSTTSTTY